MKRKIVCGICALSLTLLCSSCGSSDNSKSDNTPEPIGTVNSTAAAEQKASTEFKAIKVNDISALTDRIKYESLSQAIEKADLIVTGEFIEDGTAEFKYGDPENKKYFKGVTAYNTFKIDKVLKGECQSETVKIRQDCGIDTNDGEEVLYSTSELTPMFKGSKWIYILKKPQLEDNADYYFPTGDSQGRYPVPEALDVPDEYGFVNGVLDSSNFNRQWYTELIEKFGL